MSSIKWSKLFSTNEYKSFLFCSENSFVHQNAVDSTEFKIVPFKIRDYFDPLGVRRLRRALVENQIDTVILHRLTDLWVVVQAVRGLKGIRIISFARIFLKNNSKKDFLHRWLYRKLDVLIALSTSQRAKLVENLPISLDKIKVIPNGVDIDLFSPGSRNDLLRRTFGVSGKETVLIGLVGRIDKQKGQKELVRAASHLLKERNDLQFVLIGAETANEENSYKEELQTMIARVNLEERVLLTGHRTDMADVYRSLDIFIMPSYEENFANSLLEAMACGSLVIGTKSGGTSDIIDDGKNGFLIEPRSADSIKKGVERALESKSEWDSIRQSARKKAEESFDLNKVFAQVERVI